MKNVKWSFVLLLLVFCSCALSAKNAYGVVYSYFPPVSVVDVCTTDTATVVTFLWDSGKDACTLRVPDVVYLIDSSGKRYNMKWIDGLSLGKNEVGRNQKVEFSVCFAPLPMGETVFDVVSGCTFDRLFCFYGVHRKHTKLQYKGYVPMDEALDETMCKDGNVCVVGTIKNYDPVRTKPRAHIDCISHAPSYDVFEGFSTQIDSLGQFVFDIPSVGYRWSYLCVGGAEIPVSLLPGDTIRCVIDNLAQYNQEVELANAKGGNLHRNLLAADPNGPFCAHLAYLGVTQPLAKTRRMIAKEKKQIGDFYKYLAWKYGLTSFELDLMNLNASQRLEIAWLRSVCSVAGSEKYAESSYLLDDKRCEMCPEATALKLNQDRWKTSIVKPDKE